MDDNTINELLQMIDEGKFTADPIAWNLYRQINNLEIAYNWSGSDIFNTTGDFKVIDDYTTDIDSVSDIPKLEELLKILKGELKMIKVEVIEDFTLGKFNELRNLVRKNPNKNEQGWLYLGDNFECTEEMVEYLTKTNKEGRAFIKVIEVIPEVTEEVVQAVATAIVEEADEQGKEVKEVVEEIIEEAKPKKKTTKKTTTRKTTAKKTTKK